MNESDGTTLANRATKVLKEKYRSFIECSWNQNDQCLIYQFGSDLDAEQCIMWLHLAGNKFPVEKKIHHAGLTVLREYRNVAQG